MTPRPPSPIVSIHLAPPHTLHTQRRRLFRVILVACGWTKWIHNNNDGGSPSYCPHPPIPPHRLPQPPPCPPLSSRPHPPCPSLTRRRATARNRPHVLARHRHHSHPLSDAHGPPPPSGSRRARPTYPTSRPLHAHPALALAPPRPAHRRARNSDVATTKT
jgi:hypothetical protein